MAGHVVGQRRWFLVEVTQGDADRVVAEERWSASQAVVGEDAEGVDVGGAGQGLPGHLLGGHVAGRSHGLPDAGHRGGVR
jgi:hypothetical protein